MNHLGLLFNLYDTGVVGVDVDVVADLRGRVKRVVFDNVCFGYNYIDSGVSHNSVLDRLLYISDQSMIFEIKHMGYADDSTLLAEVSYHSDRVSAVYDLLIVILLC